MDARIGTELAGYRIESVIGRGGMGVVYLAEHLQLQRKVALKILAPELAGDERFRSRFLRESQLAASIDHPNVITVHDAGEANGVLYIAMRFVEGTDLKTLLGREGPLDPARAVEIVAQVAAGLDAAHEKGLIHRDVKPANILLGAGDQAYLTDFGLTRRTTSESGLTRTGQFLGTADYMAPEQVKGDPVDGRADVYAMGATLYEALTGEPPFVRDTEMAVLYAHLHDTPPVASKRAAGLPEAIDAVLSRALAKDPADRFAAAGEFADAAKHALSGRPFVDVAGPARSRVRLIVPAVIAVAVIAAAVVQLLTRGGSPRPPSTAGQSPPPVVSAGLERLDPRTLKRAATVPVDQARSVVVFGGFVWVADPRGVEKINPATNKIVAHFTADWTFNVVATGDGQLWMSSGICGRAGNRQLCQTTVYRLDPKTNRAIETFRFRHGLGAGDLAVGGGSVWLADPIVGRITRIDPITGKIQASIDVENSSGSQFQANRAIAFARGALWVLQQPGNSVADIDATTNRIRDELSFPSPTNITTDSDILWISEGAAGSVTSFNPTTGARVSVHVGGDAGWVAVRGGAVWVLDTESGRLIRIDSGSDRVAGSVGVGSSPQAVAVDDSAVWVTR